MEVDLTQRELKLIKNLLFWTGRVYRNQELPGNVNLWDPHKEVLWSKINDALDCTKLATSFEERTET